MNSEVMLNQKADRKIYSRDDMIRYFYCPKEVPVYLMEFPEIINDNVNDFWYKKPLPKFDNVTIQNPDNKLRSNVVANKFKSRQPPNNNQYGEAPDSSKYRTQQPRPISEQYNRYNLLNESHDNAKVTEKEAEVGWQTVESKPYKVNNLSKQYGVNYQGPEDHWKKWGKDRNLSGDKPSTPFNKNEKTNNFVVRKMDADNDRTRTKPQINRSQSTISGQTEDIWQDDWDTEMRSQITTSRQGESLETYELPPSSVDGYNQWFYRDMSNTIQGPFPSDKMANWLATGFLDHLTSIRRMCDEQFLLLVEYRALYNRIPFTVGPAVSPILQDTIIDIDPTKLAAGVDRVTWEKILSNATSLSSKKSPPPMSNEMSLANEIDKQALIEEKRQIEESKAELERDRLKMQEEKEQWKLRMEKEMAERMESLFLQKTMELTKTITDLSTKVLPVEEVMIEETPTAIVPERLTEELITETYEIIEEKEEEAPIIVTLTVTPEKRVKREETDDVNNNEWFSMKDTKNSKKNKKSKNNKQPQRQSPEPTAVPAAVVKKQDLDKSIKIISESGSIRIIEREAVTDIKPQTVKTMESPKNEHISWSIKPTILNIEPQKVAKSLLEIQAEESKQEKARHELSMANNRSKEEANKVTSFKESLLKSVKPSAKTMTPLIPSGKSIWDMVDSSSSIIQAEESTPQIKPVTEKKIAKPSDNYEKMLLNNDGLLNWCRGKLTKFRKDLDVLTVVELLREVSNNDVADMTRELLDDSQFSRNFAKDFVEKREELRREEEWQTVKKSNSVIEKEPPMVEVVGANNGNNNKSNKNSNKTNNNTNKKKKKMVVIDHTKFRSS